MSTEECSEPVRYPAFPQYEDRVTYHCMLIPKGEAVHLLADPRHMEVLNFIETRALCLIQISANGGTNGPGSSSGDGADQSSLCPWFEGGDSCGWWRLEIYYHQMRGDHKKCSALLRKLFDNLSFCRKTTVNVWSMKTVRGLFPVPYSVKTFLEHGCLRKSVRYDFPELEEVEEDEYRLEVSPKSPCSVITLSTTDSATACTSTTAFDFQLWVTKEWGLTNEDIIRISLHMMRQLLNPNKCRQLSKDLKPLNILSSIYQIALCEMKIQLNAHTC